MKFGLIGYPLAHSYSKTFFETKFQSFGLTDFSYDNYEIENIEDVSSILRKDIFGLNVTIPHKENILNYINQIDLTALQIGAVNTLVRTSQYSWKGYNTDYSGFKSSLEEWMKGYEFPKRALILGTGGAAKAVYYALTQLGIKPTMISRSVKGGFTYEDLTDEMIKNHLLIVNATPVGMEPQTDESPSLPYDSLTKDHWLYDLIYNPTNTLFLRRGEQAGAFTKNGLDMLHLQAEHAWMIWKSYGKF
jgi:shikimate dehydrogenase